MAVQPAVRVPMVDLASRHAAAGGEVEDRVVEVLRSGWYIGGPVVDELECTLAARNQRAFAVGVGSGTSALRLALQALGVGPGDEVIVPAVSFFATLEAVLQTGASPVVVDVLPDRPLLDPDAVSAARTPSTACVIPVHLFGSVAPVEALPADLPVVDDAAQAVVGVPAHGRGSLSAVSFYPTKVLGAAGDGGLVLTDDPELARAVRLLANHGMTGPRDFAPISGHVAGNDRLDAVQAAVLLGSLSRLDERLRVRQRLAAALDEVVGELALPRDAEGPVSVYAIRHPSRDALAAALLARGVQTRIYYPYTLAELAPRFPSARVHATPQADRFRDETLALPCHADLDERQLEHLLDTLGALL